MSRTSVAAAGASVSDGVRRGGGLIWLSVLLAVAMACTGTESREQAADDVDWRLLGEARLAGDSRTGIATNESQFEFLWDAIGFDDARPVVDFNGEVVVWFGSTVSSSPDCQRRLGDVIVDQNEAYIRPDLVPTGTATECNADANPHDHVVAIRRDRLPVGPFDVALHDLEFSPPQTITSLLVDLSEPGSIAGPDEIRSGPGNPALTTFREGERPTMIVGSSVAFGPSTLCEGLQIGPVNRMVWIAEHDLPAAWADAPGPADLPEFEVVTTADPPAITLTAAGVSLRYLPAGPWPGWEEARSCRPLDSPGSGEDEERRSAWRSAL